ncbi:MAG: preprotein translocase subunit SecG [Deltaproteobacteria bacterium]|nr:preprotein translocase subunit SecG [Deltaproteobacteria bacterium]
MYILIVALHVIICIILIMVVLLQTGKGAEMGAAFGGSSQTVFGSSGPGTFLSKMTTIVAIVFMLTSLWLAYFAYHKKSSLMEDAVKAPVEQTVPATTEKAAVPAVPATPAQPVAPGATQKQ